MASNLQHRVKARYLLITWSRVSLAVMIRTYTLQADPDA